MTEGVGVTIRIEGLRKLERDLSPQHVDTALGRIVQDVTDWAIVKRVSVYPTRGPWNRPGPYPKRWYQRLVGPAYALKGGGTRIRKTSQQLQDNWKQQRLSPLAREIFTDVDYAPFVVGAEEQAAIHAEHGWKTVEVIAEEVEADPVLDVIIARELTRELGA